MLVTLAVVGMVACGSPMEIERDLGAAIQTDRLTYQLRVIEGGLEADIELSFRNVTEMQVFVVNCGGVPRFRLEKLVDDEWAPAWSRAQFACLSPPIVVEPDGRYDYVLSIFGGDPDCGCSPRFTIEPVSGIYRIVLDGAFHSVDGAGAGQGDTLDVEKRSSNRFLLSR